MKKIEVPLYKKTDRRGRPAMYDLSGLLNPKENCAILINVGIENYGSIRSTVSRWRKLYGITGQLIYDYHPAKDGSPKKWVIWKK
jgi:hypothetical protein